MKDRKQLTEVRTAAGRAGGLASAKLGNQSKAADASWTAKGRRNRAQKLLASIGVDSAVMPPK